MSKDRGLSYILPVVADLDHGRVCDANGVSVVMVSYRVGKMNMQRRVLEQIADMLNGPATTQSQCPKCDSDQISWSNVEVDAGFCYQDALCLNCGCEFTEHYQYTHTDVND